MASTWVILVHRSVGREKSVELPGIGPVLVFNDAIAWSSSQYAMVIATRASDDLEIVCEVARLDLVLGDGPSLSALSDALTPSSTTKAEYSGEFVFTGPEYVDDDGNPQCDRHTVPWTTIKDIMAAIVAQAKKATP